jgi:hypothetical protein
VPLTPVVSFSLILTTWLWLCGASFSMEGVLQVQVVGASGGFLHDSEFDRARASQGARPPQLALLLVPDRNC